MCERNEAWRHVLQWWAVQTGHPRSSVGGGVDEVATWAAPSWVEWTGVALQIGRSIYARAPAEMLTWVESAITTQRATDRKQSSSRQEWTVLSVLQDDSKYRVKFLYEHGDGNRHRTKGNDVSMLCLLGIECSLLLELGLCQIDTRKSNK